jgi:hypothetical protein
MVPPAPPFVATSATTVEPSARVETTTSKSELGAPPARSGKSDEQRSGESETGRSGQAQGQQKQELAAARTSTARTPEKREARPDFYVEVSDGELLDLIQGDRVKVERSGSRRQNKDGTVRDYRGKYVAIRERAGQRRVLAFGKAELMADYLSNRLNVHHCQNCAAVSINPCTKCRA